MELLRRYSNRPDLVGPLVDVLRRITNPAEDGHETVTTIEGRTASPDYVRQILSEGDITELIAAYRSGTTAKALAERYGVHMSTVKKKLRKHGVRRQSRAAVPVRLPAPIRTPLPTVGKPSRRTPRQPS